MTLVRSAFALALAAAPALLAAQQPTLSPEGFEALKSRLSNRGRWGDQDELGTLNLITGERRSAAARSVQEGVTVAISGPAVDRALPPIVTRGVLVDLPRSRRTDVLAAGTVVTATDVEDWESSSGVRIQSGDVLILRVGVPKSGNPGGAAAGPDPAFAEWLHARGVAALISDGGNERLPSLVPDIANPLHRLAAETLALPVLDRVKLDALASEVAARGRPTFLFMTPGVNAGGELKALAVF